MQVGVAGTSLPLSGEEDRGIFLCFTSWMMLCFCYDPAPCFAISPGSFFARRQKALQSSPREFERAAGHAEKVYQAGHAQCLPVCQFSCSLGITPWVNM